VPDVAREIHGRHATGPDFADNGIAAAQCGAESIDGLDDAGLLESL
jgi:hypothetical protein